MWSIITESFTLNYMRKTVIGLVFRMINDKSAGTELDT